MAAHPKRPILDFGIGENEDMADALVRPPPPPPRCAQKRGRQGREIAEYADTASLLSRGGVVWSFWGVVCLGGGVFWGGFLFGGGGGSAARVMKKASGHANAENRK